MVKEFMTSRERVFACINGKDYARPPVISPTSVATLGSCSLAGISFNEVHLDADKMAALAGISYERLGFDTAAPYFSVVQEAAAFGCQID